MAQPYPADAPMPTRERLLYALYEAAELEHTLMCTYLYAAFSLKSGQAEGLSAAEAEAVARWRRSIIDVAIDEMGHLVAVWNITSALGGVPRFGRDNFPLSIGLLPAGLVVKLAPFNFDTLQHFVYLERPHGSDEPEGKGFEPERRFTRGLSAPRLTPMPIDYDTVGTFYAHLGAGLRRFAETIGEKMAFCGEPGLQLSPAEVDLKGAERVICLKTALAAFDAIVVQGEGAPKDATNSHFARFAAIRAEYRGLLDAHPGFAPAFPAAHNPVLRSPPRPEGRVWLEDEHALACVDVANAVYGLMLRLIGYSYSIVGPSDEKALAVDLAIALMRNVTLLGERAARLPAGPSHPECNAGMSFTTLRDASPLPQGAGARRFFGERLRELATAAKDLAGDGDARAGSAASGLAELAARAEREFARVADVPAGVRATIPPAKESATIVALAAETAAGAKSTADGGQPRSSGGVEAIEGKDLTLLYEGKRCIHARFCVTGAPTVFIANVKGPWIHPDAIAVDALVEIAHACPSGAIRYQRKDGHADEAAPPVNLLTTREAGPYAVHADILLDGAPLGYRATLCRCGASKNKPFCDQSHKEIGFAATGEPPSGKTDALEQRDGALAIDPERDGPLKVRGNLEIISGTGRVVARVQIGPTVPLRRQQQQAVLRRQPRAQRVSQRMTGPVHMDAERKRTAIALIKAVALLQLKVLIGAARDLALGPLALVAALVDLVFLKKREPRFFRSTLRLGERSDHWIDVWSGARDEQVPSRENVDALIARVEEVVRDPQTGARHARVLKRWAERQVARARQHAVAQISTRLAPPAPPSNRNASPSDPD